MRMTLILALALYKGTRTSEVVKGSACVHAHGRGGIGAHNSKVDLWEQAVMLSRISRHMKRSKDQLCNVAGRTR